MKTRWQDWVVLVFGVWLLISPWWLEFFTGRPYTDQTAASWNSILLGITVAFVAISALALPKKWEEWTNLILGLWLIASPWVLGFYTYTIAVANMVTVGLVIVIFSGFALIRPPPLPPAFR